MNRIPPVKPVQKIELSDKNNKLKLILVILLLALGFTAIGYGIMAAISTEKGWKEIEANSTEGLNCSSDFVFIYNIGAGGISPTVENKAITNLYSKATEDAYKIFTCDQGYDDINNIYTMNQKPNTELTVEPTLYQAFELLQKYNNRNIYLAPVYMQYDDIFYCSDDSEIVDFDPYSNEEVAAYYKEVAAFACDKDAVNVELLGSNKVILHVSDEYLAYAKENGITRFIDLFWMKNAFITDYLANIMSSNGYTLGSISSHDGFTCNMDTTNTNYAFNMYDNIDGEAYQIATANYAGARNIVTMHNFIMNAFDKYHSYELQNGEVRTSYLDIEDGLCKSAVNMYVAYAEGMSCSEIMLNIAPSYIAESLDEQVAVDLTKEKIYSVYCKDDVIIYNDSELEFTNVYDFNNVNYSTSLMRQ